MLDLVCNVRKRIFEYTGSQSRFLLGELSLGCWWEVESLDERLGIKNPH